MTTACFDASPRARVRRPDPTACALPPALRRAVDLAARHHPDFVDVEPALRHAFAHRLAHPKDLASWHLSLLTADGFPAELTFTTARDGVRYTLETFDRATSPHDRLDETVAVVPDIDDHCRALIDELRAAQATQHLTWGAWLGVRHDAGGVRYKVYAELNAATAQSRALIERLLPTPLTPPGRRVTLQMVGLQLQRPVVELYWAVEGLRPWELVTLLAPLGLQARAHDVHAHLELACGRALHQQLPTSTLGCSHSVALDDGARAFTLYGMTDALFGDDVATRRRVLRYAERTGADLTIYDAISAPLATTATSLDVSASRAIATSLDVSASRAVATSLHGLFGLTVAAAGPVVASIGVRPPDEAAP